MTAHPQLEWVKLISFWNQVSSQSIGLLMKPNMP